MLPAVLALAPRGAAWGTDEAGDGKGASPVMLRFWRAIATWVADVNARDFAVATQAFPSAITTSLTDWETDYGLPDACRTSANTVAARISAVQARFGALGGQSREYFICLAASLGYDITIEEPTQFFIDTSEIIDGDVREDWFLVDDSQCDDPVETFTLFAPPGVYGDEVAGGILEGGFDCDFSECDGDPLETFEADPAGIVWKFWVVHVASLGETWFRAGDGGLTESWFVCEDGVCDDAAIEGFGFDPVSDPPTDEGECGYDPVEGFLPADTLECVLRSACPPHTQLVFSYALAA